MFLLAIVVAAAVAVVVVVVFVEGLDVVLTISWQSLCTAPRCLELIYHMHRVMSNFLL